MKQYIDLIARILKEGHVSEDRTGTGTKKIFGHQSIYNMDDGFPLLTLKKTWMPGVTHELIWFLGNHTKLEAYKNLPMTNIKYLVDNKVHIWDEWADKSGNLGPVYGQQWVAWELPGPAEDSVWYDRNLPTSINQIQNIINKLSETIDGNPNPKFNPMDRGLIVSAWNVSDLDQMALRPCHAFFQLQARELSWEERRNIAEKTLSEKEFNGYKNEDGYWEGFGHISPFTATIIHLWLDNKAIPKYELSLQLYQRSADTFLGVPFNIASYSLLLHMICHVTGMKPGKFVHTFGDAHIYSNHREQVNQLLSRTNIYGPSTNVSTDTFKNEKDHVIDYWNTIGNWSAGPYMGPKLPELWLNPEVKNIFDFQYSDIKLLNYNALPAIKADVAV